MSARDDHAERVIAGVSEPMCWRALFDEIDRLRAEVDTLRFNLHECKSTLTAILAKQEAEP